MAEQQIVLSRVAAADHPTVIGAVGALAGETPAQVRQDLDNSQYSPYEPVPVMNDAPIVHRAVRRGHPSEFPGVSLQEVSERVSRHGGGNDVASQVLGYVSAITAGRAQGQHPTDGYSEATQYGQTGLENEYRAVLPGRPVPGCCR